MAPKSTAVKHQLTVEVRPEGGLRLQIAEPLPLAVGARVAVRKAGDPRSFEGRALRNFASGWIEFSPEDCERVLGAFGWETGESVAVTLDTRDGLPLDLSLQAVLFLSAAAGLVDPLAEIARASAANAVIAKSQRDHVRKIARALLCWGTCLKFATPADWKRAASGCDDQPGAQTVRAVADRIARDEQSAEAAQASGDDLIAAAVALRDASEAKEAEEFSERATYGARELLNGLRLWETVLPRKGK